MSSSNKRFTPAVRHAALFLVCLSALASCRKDLDMTLVSESAADGVSVAHVVADKPWQVEVVADGRRGVDLDYSAFLADYLVCSPDADTLRLGLRLGGGLPAGTVLKARVHLDTLRSCRLDGGASLAAQGYFADFKLRLSGGASFNGGCFAACEAFLDEGTTFSGFAAGGDFSLTAGADARCVGSWQPRSEQAAITLELDGASFVNLAEGRAGHAVVKARGNSLANLALTTLEDGLSVEMRGSELTARFGTHATLGGSLKEGSTLYYYGVPSLDGFECDDSSQAVGL